MVGGLHDRGVIVDGSLDDIEKSVHTVLDDVGDRNFMVGADCTLPTDNSLANIRQAVQATASWSAPA